MPARTAMTFWAVMAAVLGATTAMPTVHAAQQKAAAKHRAINNYRTQGWLGHSAALPQPPLASASPGRRPACSTSAPTNSARRAS